MSNSYPRLMAASVVGICSWFWLASVSPGQAQTVRETSRTPYQGALEICDGPDKDCDGIMDDGLGSVCDSPDRLGSDVRVTNEVLKSEYSSLVWTGSEYGVSWHDTRDGSYEIYFARLDAGGNKLGPDVRVTDDTADDASASLVWTGSEYGVSWSHDRGDGHAEIYFARLDAAGNKLGADVRATDDGAKSAWSSLVWTGSEFGVSWQDYRDSNHEIYFARLDAAGSKIGSDIRVTDHLLGVSRPTLVWNGSEFGVSWMDFRDDLPEIYFARLDAGGNKIGGDVRGTNGMYAYFPSMVWTGSEYGVSWRDSADAVLKIYLARLDAGGNKLAPDVLVTDRAAEPSAPSLVWTGTEYGVSWFDGRGQAFEIYFAKLDAEGNIIDADVRVTDDDANARYPAMVWTGSGYGVSWHDLRHGDSEIYFARIGCGCFDSDLDGVSICSNDCDDTNATIYPGAVQLCDGLNNDCLDSAWPTVPADETDDDADTYAECQGDCDDTAPAVNPAATEMCNAVDDNCNTLVDEDELGEDTDSDGIHNACDNCPNDANYYQDDYDGDSYGDACDNCFVDWNPTQTDVDSDDEGDVCDLNDGMIYILFHQPEWVEWQEELGFASWNSYRGDLTVLKSTGLYAQDPALVPLAGRSCDLTVPWEADVDPPAGVALFFLTTGNYTGTGVENSLGTNSDGIGRLNANPCP